MLSDGVDLIDEFRTKLDALELTGTAALVAVSGGPDSVALLDLLVRSRDAHGFGLVVAHVDHGIHPESHHVAARVAALAEHYGLRFESGELRLGPAAGETVARAERHAWLEAARVRVGADVIFLAHHADDQIETVLMRVLRGSGPAGLAGMAERHGHLVRPLLSFRRSALVAYVEAAGLPVWLDPANADPRYLRSWLRAEILPALRAHVPDVDLHLLRVSRQAAQDRAAWDVVIGRLPELAVRMEADGISIARAPLAGADRVLTAALVKATARRVGCPLGPSRLTRVEMLLQAGESGSAVPLGGRWRAELSFDRLHLVATPPGHERGLEPWQVQGEAGERSWGRWRFHWRHEPAPAEQSRQSYSAWFADGSLGVRRWRPGDAIRPLSGRGRRPVTRVFQEARVPRWRRSAWPVIVASIVASHETAAEPTEQRQLVWVPGICRSDALLPVAGQLALRLDAEYA